MVTCKAVGCSTRLRGKAQVFCIRHWHLLAKRFRTEIAIAYRRGQTERSASPEYYLAVARATLRLAVADGKISAAEAVERMRQVRSQYE